MKYRLPSYFIFSAALLLLESTDAFSQTIISVQDGNWEDSATWNIHEPLADSISVDSIIIFHHINYNDSLQINNCVFVLDSNASLCGHFNIHFINSTAYSYGQFYTYFLTIESSHFYTWYGMVIHSCGARLFGAIGTNFQIHGGSSKTLWDYDCTFPPTSWHDQYMCGGMPPDTSFNDTTEVIVIKPIVINVNPNPFQYQFVVTSEIPDSSSKVSVTVYDLPGREMKKFTIPTGKSTLTIFTHDWVAGMYLLRFMNGESPIKTEKIVRVR